MKSRTGIVMAVAVAVAALSIAADIAVRAVVPVSMITILGLWAMTRAHQLRTNHTASTARRRIDTTTAELDRRIDDIGREIESLEDAQDRRVRAVVDRTEEVWDRTSFMRRLIDEDRERLRKVDTDIISRTWANTQMTREGLRILRAEIDELSALNAPTPEMEEEITAVTGAHPALSIAIPGYNRSELLTQCLESIVAEVEATGTDRVEVWVTDDRSSRRSAIEAARDFATRYPYIGFRLNPENVGLEANLINACQPCRGSYVLILGNDDKLFPGALSEVLEDIDRGAHDLVVYGKVRINPNGEVLDNPAAGAIPADASPGERREYRDVLGFARSTGVLSGYGFISVVLMRRDQFLAVDGGKYLGLTMYPQVGRILEAFAQSATLFRNVPVVFHRTTARPEKLAESAGRPEESFMIGGIDRDMRWFGPTLAALLMRVCDATPLVPRDFFDVPEHLFGHDRLITWIRDNAELAGHRGVELDTDVQTDADRFIAALPDAEPPRSDRPATAEIDTPSAGAAPRTGGSPASAEQTQTAVRPATDATSTATASSSEAPFPRYVTVTKVELETLVARVEALEEALDAIADEA